MTKLTIAMAALLMLAIGGVSATQEKPKIVKAPPVKTDVSDGPAMFKAYCAPCHGVNGTGNGPAAAALKTAPADLTRISERNGGTFPAIKVRRFIEGADEVPAHGSREMPVWGQVLRSLGDKDQVLLRVTALTNHVESMQKK